MSFLPQVNATFDAGILKNWASTTGVFGGVPAVNYSKSLDDDGYPQTLTQTVGCVGFIPSDVLVTETLVIAWSGTIVNFGVQIARGAPGFTVTVGSQFLVGGTDFNINCTGTNGYIEFTFNGTIPVDSSGRPAFTLNFGAGNNTNFSGLFIGRKKDYASWLAAAKPEDLFADEYINLMKGLKVSTVRMLGLNNPNDGNNVTQHRYRNKWKTARNFGTENIPVGAVTASANGIISGTNTYTCLQSPDCGTTLTRGDVVIGWVSNASTGACTLNDGRGARPIYGIGGGPAGANDVQNLMCFIFDDLLDTNGAWLVGYGAGILSLIPIEMCVGLCNRLNTNLWWNIPPHFNWNEITAVVNYVRDNLNSSLEFTIEYANEIWNFGFPPTGWANNCGLAFGAPNSSNRRIHMWYGYALTKFGPLIKAAWSPRSASQLHIAIGLQGAGNTVPGGDWDVYRLRGGDLNTSLGYTKYNSYVGQNYNAYPNRPRDLCDTIAPGAYYYGGQLYNSDVKYLNESTGNTAGLTNAADQFAAGGASNIAAAMAWCDADIRKGLRVDGTTNTESLGPQISVRFPQWESLAASFDGDGSARLTVSIYESAMEAWWPTPSTCTSIGISSAYGGPTGKIANMLDAYKQTPLFYNLVLDAMTALSRQPHSGQPSWFQVGGGNTWSMSRYGSSDALGTLYQSANAVRALGGGLRRMTVKR